MTNHSNIGPIVDDLGKVKAEIAKLKEREAELKAVLSQIGPGAYDGKLFRATVSQASRTILDSKAIYAEMPESWIVTHSQTATVETIKVTSLSAAASGKSEKAKSRGRERAEKLAEEIAGMGGRFHHA